jgi:hypothetical protein
MTQDTELRIKMYKVIHSCKTHTQLKTAKRFCFLAIRQMYKDVVIPWQRYILGLFMTTLLSKEITERYSELLRLKHLKTRYGVAL